jgi:hypothetical protein
MPMHVELTDEETRCLHRYFERVDETDDLSFRHPGEFLAFQRIASQVCRASAAKLARNYAKLLTFARTFVSRPPARQHAIATIGANAGETAGTSARFAGAGAHEVTDGDDTTRSGESSPQLAIAAAARSIVDTCVAAFDERDTQTLIALFADDARVFSPFFGYQDAGRFLADLFGRRSGAKLTQHGIVTNIEGRPQALGYFLLDAEPAHFDADDMSGGGGDVFYYVMNLDASASAIQSMIVLDA